MSQPTQKQSKESIVDKYECGNGPRPPVPGEESQLSKMTTEGAICNSTSNPNQSPESESTFSARIAKWNRGFDYLLADEEGVQQLLKFVEEDFGTDSIEKTRIDFYFTIEGLKQNKDEAMIRRLIKLIKSTIRNRIEIPSKIKEKISKMTKVIDGKSELPPDPHIFDELQQKVRDQIANEIYPKFLISSVLIDFVEKHKDLDEKPINITNQASCISRSNVVSSSIAVGAAGLTVGLTPLVASSNLQTLHEDAELNLIEGPTLKKTTTDRPMPKLTLDNLLATQGRRMEVRPQGAQGHILFPTSSNSSYNPVSRQDSERQSLSSASLTDSEMNSKDGRPFIHRKFTAAEDPRKNYMNPPSASQRTLIRPTSQGLREPMDVNGTSQGRLDQARFKFDPNELLERLNKVKRDQEIRENNENLALRVHERLEKQRVFPAMEEDDGQSILDQHVSRVFSPNNNNSPGTISPKHLNRLHHRSNEMTTSMPEFAQHASMRHSRSMEHASIASNASNATSKKWSSINRWPSMNNDSGLGSLYSADLPYKPGKPIDPTMDDTLRKSRMSHMRKQLPLPPSHPQNFMPTSSSHHTNSLARTHVPDEEYTTAVYKFADEKVPYRTRIPGKLLTLRQFKDHSPKMTKGNFRYFFTATEDDPENPVILQEVVNDTDVLPIYEGKVMGTIKFDKSS